MVSPAKSPKPRATSSASSSSAPEQTQQLLIFEGRNDDIQSCVELYACATGMLSILKDILWHVYNSTHDCISSFRAGNHFVYKIFYI